MKVYHGSGHAYFVCPALIEADPRHGEHHSKWPPCRRAKGTACPLKHKHEEPLEDPEGHLAVDFYWVPDGRPPTEAELWRCNCGQTLVLADLADPYEARHFRELEAEPDA